MRFISRRAFSIGISAGILLIGAIAMLSHANALTLWSDEIWSVFHTSGALSQVILDPDVTWPPGYYLILHFWSHFASNNDFSLHVLGALSGLIATACLIRAGRRLWSPAVGWLAGLAFATSSYAIYFFLEVRGYGLMLLAEAFFLWMYLRWRKNPNLRRSGLLLISQLALLYVQFILIIPLALAGAHTLILAARRSDRPHLIRWLIIAFLTGIGFLPLLPQFLRGASLRTAVGTGNLPGYFLRPFYTFYQAYSAHWDIWFALILIAAALGLIALYQRIGWQTLGWLLIWAIAIPVGAYLTEARSASFTTRYLTFTMPALFLLIGVGLAGWISVGTPFLASGNGKTGRQKWRPYPRTIVRGLPGLITFGFILILAIAPWQPYDHRPAASDTPPLGEFMRAMANKAQPGDSLLIDPHAGCCDPVAWSYYRSLYFPQSAFHIITDESQAGTRVWYIERQGSTDQTLKSTVMQGRIVRDFWGPWYFAATLYEAPPLADGVRFGDSIRFRGAEINRRPEIESGDVIPVTLWWSADSVPKGDYSISLRLIDPTGKLITNQDSGPQATGTPPQFTLWQPNIPYLDTRTLTVPYQLDDGDYTIQVVVYQSWDGQRLTPAVLEKSTTASPLTITAAHALIIDQVHLRSYAVWHILPSPTR